MVHYHTEGWSQELEGAWPFTCQSGGSSVVLAVTLDLVLVMFWEWKKKQIEARCQFH